MSQFYKNFLGAHANYENDYVCFLTYDGEHHRIAISKGVSPNPELEMGYAHVAFAYGSVEDLLVAYRQRKALGYLPVKTTHHGNTISFYYEDPDGNRLETLVDCFATTQEAVDFMSTEVFARQPGGYFIDPETMIQRLQSGESEASIKKRDDLKI